MGTLEQEHTGKYAKRKGNLDYSKSEELTKNIIIPNSQFGAKWIKGEGYAIGIENIKLTKDYDRLEGALNTIGYGVDKDEEDNEVLVKVGDIDYEMVARIVKAIIIIEKEKH